ncbi:MAG: DUF4830 domain-containing protein [Clostridia bacterium]|nr:DUF4830 domain-containing protein [Clostridia bacterium]
MFVWSVRASTLKFIAVILVCAAAVGTLAAFMPRYEIAAETADAPEISKKLSGEDGVKQFLLQYGWETSELVDQAEVTIPADFDSVYESYNTLQKKQDFDLSKYKRKTVKRYTYKIDNYEGYSGVVLADVIVYKNKVIGGDICSADVNGFVHGFSPDVTLP